MGRRFEHAPQTAATHASQLLELTIKNANPGDDSRSRGPERCYPESLVPVETQNDRVALIPAEIHLREDRAPGEIEP